MKRGLLASLAALLAAMLVVSIIAAQGSYPLNDTFDSTANGWAPAQHQLPDGHYVAYATVTWLAEKDLTALFPPSITQAQGVIQISASPNHTPNIRKTVYLQPGFYQIRFRAGSEIDNNLLVVLEGGVINPGTYFEAPWLPNQWYENTTDVFSVVAPGPITIIFLGMTQFYLDYIRIEPYTTGATPTPYATLAVTPIPTAQQATPMPVPTQYCQPPAATPTGPASFDVTPTATPDTSGDWQFIDTFSEQALSSTNWETSNAGATVNTIMSGPDNAEGVLVMPYASGPAIIYFHDITPTIYVDGWAMANALPIGSSATVHVMLWDSPTYGWVAAGTENFGPGQWYPFHITVTDPGLHSLPGTAVAIYVSGPAGDKAYLDNIYIYNSTRGAPICGFSEGPSGEINSAFLTYPWDKPCPSETSGIQDVPNNFWGPLFFWMSIQFLQITAPFPVHDIYSYALAIEEFSNSPFWRYVQFGAIMLDWRPVFAVAGLLITLEILRVIYSIWRLLLKIIPMMG